MKIESITKENIEGLIRCVGRVSAMISGLDNVDLKKGRGILDESNSTHCLWTKEGKRITVDISKSAGSVMVSLSNNIDEELPPDLEQLCS